MKIAGPGSLALALVWLVPTSCTPGIAIEEGGGGTAASSATTNDATHGSTVGTTSSVTTTATSSSTGCDASSCADGNPCTDDVCGTSGVCENTQKATGSVGNLAEGPCEGVCQTDGHCGLRAYSRNFPSPSGPWTDNPPALSEVWSGANAPPPRGILAASQKYDNDDLLVWADDGNFYLRLGTAWQAPVPIATAFPGLTASNLACVEMYQSQSGGHYSLLVATSGTTPLHAYGYDLSPTNVIVADSGNPYDIGAVSDPEGAPQESVACGWSLVVQKAYLGTPQWVVFYRQYDSKLYLYDGGSGHYVSNWDDAASPLWMASGTAPAPNTVVAGFRSGSTTYLLAP